MDTTNYRRWSHEEDAVLLRYVRAHPQNLRKCFLCVAEQIGRSEGAVANRWYTVVSKDTNNTCFFTAGIHHVSRNRKNGEGIRTTSNIWRRLMNIIKNI